MTDVFMKEVQCVNCERNTRHLLPILERIIQLQSALSEGDTYINYACPQCNTLMRSLVVRGAKVFREVDLSKFPDDLTLYGVSLQCAKTGCESRVILLAPVKREISEEDLLTHMQTNWRNLSALCANNHRPIYPLEIHEWVKWPQ
jgi:hypothetical protein